MGTVNAKRVAKIVALHDKGLSTRQIMAEVGMSQSTVRVALYQAHRIPDHSIARLGDQFDTVVQGWSDGLTVPQLAKLVGKTHDSMKWILIIMRAYGHIKERPQVPVNKGKHMPMRQKHKDVYDRLVAVPGWEKMKRGDLAAALKMPVNVFIIYWRVFRNRGLVSPKAKGKTPGSAADVRSASRRLTSGSDREQNLWATALGRRTL